MSLYICIYSCMSVWEQNLIGKAKDGTQVALIQMFASLPSSELLTLWKLYSIFQKHLVSDRHQGMLLILFVTKPWTPSSISPSISLREYITFIPSWILEINCFPYPQFIHAFSWNKTPILPGKSSLLHSLLCGLHGPGLANRR